MNLTDYLRKTKQSHAELAEKLDVSRQHVTQIVAGKELPGLGLAVKIEKLTGIPVAHWVEKRVKP